MLDARDARDEIAPAGGWRAGPRLWRERRRSRRRDSAIARIGQDGRTAEAADGSGSGSPCTTSRTSRASFGRVPVMFDPHATHLPARRPRGRLKIQLKGDLSQFPTSSRRTPTCSGATSRPSTTPPCSFPLRTEASAKTSEIKPEAYTADAGGDCRRLQRPSRGDALVSETRSENRRVQRRSERGAPELLYEARASGFEGGADPRRSVLRWVGGGRGGGRTEGVPREAPSTPDANPPSSVGWMDLELETSRDPSEEPAGGDHEVGTGGAEGNTHASSSKKRSVVVAERWMVCKSPPAATSGARALGRRRNARPGAVRVAARAPFNRTPTRYY